MDAIEEIKKIKTLLDQGAITNEEFNALKSKVLSQGSIESVEMETSPTHSQISSKVDSHNESTEAQFDIPLWVGWVINVVAWILFVLTSVHAVDIAMGVACIFSFYIGLKHKHNNLMYASIFDTIWMFTWGLGFFDSMIY